MIKQFINFLSNILPLNFCSLVFLFVILTGGIMISTSTVDAADDEVIDGAVEDNSSKNARKTIISKDITFFSAKFAWNDEIGHSENGRFIPDEYQPYPYGIWLLTLKKSGSKAQFGMHCAEANFALSGKVRATTLLSLQELIERNGIAKFNGHSKWDSALGEFLDLHIDYASGEVINANARGGSATLPNQWNPVVFLDFFRKIALEHKLWPKK